MIQKSRLPFVFLALASLIVGLVAGLGRLGWNISIGDAMPHHGSIMVGGFLGTLIVLEKIIPLKKWYLYGIPLLSAGSVLMFFLGFAFNGMILLITASVCLVAVCCVYLLMTRSLVYVLMAIGAVCWLIGNVMLASSFFYPAAFPWWMGFVLFIITSERLELMKFLPVRNRSRALLILLVVTFIVGCASSFHGVGRYASSVSLAGISLWLFRNDAVNVLIRKSGLSRFIAVTLVAGYFCMLLTAIMLLVLIDAPYSLDVVVHLFFIGFVFSMIFAHGPSILPGVLGVSSKPFSRVLYVWLILLHASLMARIAADILLLIEWRKYSGILTMLAILGYFITMAVLMFRDLARTDKSQFYQ